MWYLRSKTYYCCNFLKVLLLILTYLNINSSKYVFFWWLQDSLLNGKGSCEQPINGRSSCVGTLTEEIAVRVLLETGRLPFLPEMLSTNPSAISWETLCSVWAVSSILCDPNWGTKLWKWVRATNPIGTTLALT